MIIIILEQGLRSNHKWTFSNHPYSRHGATSPQPFQCDELIWQLTVCCEFILSETGTLGQVSWIVAAYRFSCSFLLGVICLRAVVLPNFFYFFLFSWHHGTEQFVPGRPFLSRSAIKAAIELLIQPGIAPNTYPQAFNGKSTGPQKLPPNGARELV